jgi:hypothetical protein
VFNLCHNVIAHSRLDVLIISIMCEHRQNIQLHELGGPVFILMTKNSKNVMITMWVLKM